MMQRTMNLKGNESKKENSNVSNHSKPNPLVDETRGSNEIRNSSSSSNNDMYESEDLENLPEYERELILAKRHEELVRKKQRVFLFKNVNTQNDDINRNVILSNKGFGKKNETYTNTGIGTGTGTGTGASGRVRVRSNNKTTKNKTNRKGVLKKKKKLQKKKKKQTRALIKENVKNQKQKRYKKVGKRGRLKKKHLTCKDNEEEEEEEEEDYEEDENEKDYEEEEEEEQEEHEEHDDDEEEDYEEEDDNYDEEEEEEEEEEEIYDESTSDVNRKDRIGISEKRKGKYSGSFEKDEEFETVSNKEEIEEDFEEEEDDSDDTSDFLPSELTGSVKKRKKKLKRKEKTNKKKKRERGSTDIASKGKKRILKKYKKTTNRELHKRIGSNLNKNAGMTNGTEQSDSEPIKRLSSVDGFQLEEEREIKKDASNEKYVSKKKNLDILTNRNIKNEYHHSGFSLLSKDGQNQILENKDSAYMKRNTERLIHLYKEEKQVKLEIYKYMTYEAISCFQLKKTLLLDMSEHIYFARFVNGHIVRIVDPMKLIKTADIFKEQANGNVCSNEIMNGIKEKAKNKEKNDIVNHIHNWKAKEDEEKEEEEKEKEKEKEGKVKKAEEVEVERKEKEKWKELDHSKEEVNIKGSDTFVKRKTNWNENKNTTDVSSSTHINNTKNSDNNNDNNNNNSDDNNNNNNDNNNNNNDNNNNNNDNNDNTSNNNNADAIPEDRKRIFFITNIINCDSYFCIDRYVNIKFEITRFDNISHSDFINQLRDTMIKNKKISMNMLERSNSEKYICNMNDISDENISVDEYNYIKLFLGDVELLREFSLFIREKTEDLKKFHYTEKQIQELVERKKRKNLNELFMNNKNTESLSVSRATIQNEICSLLREIDTLNYSKRHIKEDKKSLKVVDAQIEQLTKRIEKFRHLLEQSRKNDLSAQRLSSHSQIKGKDELKGRDQLKNKENELAIEKMGSDHTLQVSRERDLHAKSLADEEKKVAQLSNHINAENKKFHNSLTKKLNTIPIEAHHAICKHFLLTGLEQDPLTLCNDQVKKKEHSLEIFGIPLNDYVTTLDEVKKKYYYE